MEIQIVSDTVCPWCYVGKRNLELAMAQRPELEFRVTWLPFQLNPDMPIEGADRKTYWREKFGSDETIATMTQRLESIGKEIGLAFDFEAIERQPNTLRSHVLLHWQMGSGKQSELKEALLHAFFMQGQDIGNEQVLINVARQVGLNEADAVNVLRDKEQHALVQSLALEARSQGVSGVPTFIFDKKNALVGAQPASALLKAIDQSE